MKKIANSLLFIGPIILSFLSVLSENEENWFLKLMVDYKVRISITILALIILIQIWKIFLQKEDRIIKIWVDEFLRFIAREDLGGGEYKTRISIFRRQKGIIFIWKYIYIIIKNPSKIFTCKTYRDIKNILFSISSNFLTLYARYSYPNEDITSYTYFKASGRNGKINGVVDKCNKEGIEIEVNTCVISNIELPINIEEWKNNKNSNSKYKDVMKYMKDSFIDEKNYETLLNMNTKANNLYAIAITDKNQAVWGVLIIDNVGDKRSFKEELTPVIEKYAKIFCFTLSIVK